MDLRNKSVVVSGASRGIGAAVARALAREGCQLILLARSEKDLAQVVSDIVGAGGKAVYYAVDLSDREQLYATAEQILREQGQPDVLVNNAGLGRWLYLEETPADEADLMVELPFKAAMHLSRAFLPGMLAQKSGHILMVNSPVAYLSWPGATVYTSSRWALRGLAAGLRADLRGTGVGLSECYFGETDSHYFDANPGARERLPSVAKWIPVLSPEQAAQGVVKALKRNKKAHFQPFTIRFFCWLQLKMPGLVRWIVGMTGWKRK